MQHQPAEQSLVKRLAALLGPFILAGCVVAGLVVIHSFKFSLGGSTAPIPLGLFVGSLDGSLYTLDAQTGKLRWSQKVGDAVAGVQVVDGVAYVSAANGEGQALSAFDAATGKLHWSGHMASKIPSAPAVANGAVAIASNAGDVYAFSTFDGQLLWQRKSAGRVQVAATGDQIFTVETDTAGASVLSAIDSRLGKVRWSVPAPGAAEVFSGLWAGYGAVYATLFAASQQVSYEYAFDASDGTPRWQSQAFTGTANPPGSLVEVSVGSSYLPLADGSIIALSVGSGEQLWRYTPAAGEAAFPLGIASPSVGQGNREVYVGENGHITTLDVEDGMVIKKMAMAHYHGSPFVVDGMSLFINTDDGVIHRLNLEDSSQAWQYTYFQPHQKTGFDAASMVLAPFR